MVKFVFLLMCVFLVWTKANPCCPIYAKKVFELHHWWVVHKVNGDVVVFYKDEVLNILELNDQGDK